MSYVTDSILVCSLDEPCTDLVPDGVHELNKYVRDNFNATFNCVSRSSGGRYRPHCLVFQSAFNHLAHEELVEKVDQIDWRIKHAVQILLKPKNEFLFSMWRFSKTNAPELLNPNEALYRQLALD